MALPHADAPAIPGPAAPRGARLLVVMPALNEAATIGSVIDAVPRDIDGVGEVDVLVINDGSRDATAAEARQAGAAVIHHNKPRGVGAAFHSALRYAIEHGADLIVSIDSDGQFDPKQIPRLVRPILDDEADFVSASRFIDPQYVPTMPAVKKWGNRLMSRLISGITGQRFYDVSCGMRCYSRRAALNLTLIGSFTYTQEVFINLAYKGFRIAEVPMVVRGERVHGRSRVAGNLWRYGLQTLKIILRGYRDYRPMRFFGAIAGILAASAFGLMGFLAVHYLRAGQFTPHKWAGFVALGLVVLALMMLHIGLIGDMLNRHRTYLEELLYHQRVQRYMGRAGARDEQTGATDRQD